MADSTCEALLSRLAQVEPEARALEENGSERRALTEQVFGLGQRILDGLADRSVWEDSAGAARELLELGIPEQPQAVARVLDRLADQRRREASSDASAGSASAPMLVSSFAR